MKSTIVLFSRICIIAAILILAGCGTHQPSKSESNKKNPKPIAANKAKVEKQSPKQQSSNEDWTKALSQSSDNLGDILNPLAKSSQGNQQKSAPNIKPTSPMSQSVSRPQPTARPTAKQLLGIVQLVYSRTKTLKASGNADMVTKQDGKITKREKKSKQTILFKRPDKFVIHVQEGQLSSDGKTVYAYNEKAKRYTTKKLTKDVIWELIRGKPGIGIIGLLMGVDYLPAISSIKLLNDSKIGNNETYVLQLQLKKGVGAPPEANVTQKLWIGKKDLGIYKNEVVMRFNPKAPKGYKGKVPKLIETTLSSTMTVIQPNIKLADSVFKFHPPVGAKQYEKPKEVNLTNQPAPDFSFKTSDGAQKKLSDFKGQVVMLIYWALPMCEKSLPIIQSVYEQNKENIQLVAINLNSETAKVDEFLKSKGYNFPVVHADEAINNYAMTKYGIRGLPTTYIIDKNGIINSIILGNKPEKDINEQIDKAIKQ